jgi:hypothetical protein
MTSGEGYKLPVSSLCNIPQLPVTFSLPDQNSISAPYFEKTSIYVSPLKCMIEFYTRTKQQIKL